MEYILRGINKEWWQRVRMKALSQGKSVKQVIFGLLEKWLEGANNE